MVRDANLILGEERRTLDERFRLSIPPPFVVPLGGEQATCILAKERLGCLSLWNQSQWQGRFDAGLDVIQGKLRRQARVAWRKCSCWGTCCRPDTHK